MSAPIGIRNGLTDDLGFMLTTFSKSMAAVSAYADGVSPRNLGNHIRVYLEEWPSIVAHPPDDPSTVMGWLCYKSPEAAAWVYVAPQYRRKGVARALLSHAGILPGIIETPFAPTRILWPEERGWHLRFRPWMT